MNDRKRDRAQGVAVDHRLRQRSSVRLSKMANIVPSGPYTQRDHPVTTPTVAEPRVSHALCAVFVAIADIFNCSMPVHA